MKTKFIVLTVLSILGTASVSMAFVAEEKPLISKTSGGGFTMPEYFRSETCNVYADRVEITKWYGQETGLKTLETRPLKLGGDIKEVLKKAAAEKINEKPNGLCDGPSSHVRVVVDDKDVVLYSTGGCGSPRKAREGAASQILMDLVGTYCAKTFDFSRQ